MRRSAPSAFPIIHFFLLDGQIAASFVLCCLSEQFDERSRKIQQIVETIIDTELQPSGQIFVVDGNLTFRTADGKKICNKHILSRWH